MQQNKLYVGNLSYSVNESQIKELFETYGPIDKVTLIKDRDTGKSKGFAFVTFSTNEDAEKALEQNGQEFTGRSLRVNIAKERSDRGRGGFRSGGGGKRRNYGDNRQGPRNNRQKIRG